MPVTITQAAIDNLSLIGSPPDRDGDIDVAIFGIDLTADPITQYALTPEGWVIVPMGDDYPDIGFSSDSPAPQRILDQMWEAGYRPTQYHP